NSGEIGACAAQPMGRVFTRNNRTAHGDQRNTKNQSLEPSHGALLGNVAGYVDRRRICAVKFALLLAFALAFATHATAWPDRPVRVIATGPPGGSVDLLARIAAEEFASAFGQPFVVENRPGANGNIGAEVVLRAAPDGHLLFVAPPGPFSINTQLL